MVGAWLVRACHNSGAEVLKLPSDLIVGVMQAADPARRQAATRRLTELATTDPSSGADFSSLLACSPSQCGPASAGSFSAMPDIVATAALMPRPANPEVKTPGAKDPYTKFEGFLLRTAFEDILPPAESGSFGDGYAGGVWRSMAAEQFANLFADQGGIGIAAMMRKRVAMAGAESGPSQSGQWPYFAQATLSARTS